MSDEFDDYEEMEPEPEGPLHVVKIPLGMTVEDFSAIRKERHVQAAEDLIAVFAIHDDQVVVVEAEGAEAAQVVRATQHRLEIEGNGVGVVRIGQHRPGV